MTIVVDQEITALLNRYAVGDIEKKDLYSCLQRNYQIDTDNFLYNCDEDIICLTLDKIIKRLKLFLHKRESQEQIIDWAENMISWNIVVFDDNSRYHDVISDVIHYIVEIENGIVDYDGVSNLTTHLEMLKNNPSIKSMKYPKIYS